MTGISRSPAADALNAVVPKQTSPDGRQAGKQAKAQAEDFGGFLLPQENIAAGLPQGEGQSDGAGSEKESVAVSPAMLLSLLSLSGSAKPLAAGPASGEAADAAAQLTLNQRSRIAVPVTIPNPEVPAGDATAVQSLPLPQGEATGMASPVEQAGDLLPLQQGEPPVAGVTRVAVHTHHAPAQPAPIAAQAHQTAEARLAQEKTGNGAAEHPNPAAQAILRSEARQPSAMDAPSQPLTSGDSVDAPLPPPAASPPEPGPEPEAKASQIAQASEGLSMDANAGQQPQNAPFLPPASQLARHIAASLPPAPAPTAAHAMATLPNSTSRVLTVTLEPAELGEVTLRLTLRGDKLEVSVEAAQAGTAHAIRTNSEGLSQQLAAAGYSIDALVVQVAGPERQAANPSAPDFNSASDTFSDAFSHAQSQAGGSEQREGRAGQGPSQSANGAGEGISSEKAEGHVEAVRRARAGSLYL